MLVSTSSTIVGRRVVPETGVEVLEYFGAAGTPTSDGPQCKLVKQPFDYLIRPHFHPIDQFQLIIEGEGRLGAHDVRRGTVHYSDRLTPYGPITAAEGGLSYLTLRPPSPSAANTEARYMPESRREMTVFPGRNLTVCSEFDWAEPDNSQLLIEEPDGVAVMALRTSSGEVVARPASHDPRYASYLIIVDGEMRIGAEAYGALACIWLDESDSWPALVAGDEGASAFHLRFGTGTERRAKL